MVDSWYDIVIFHCHTTNVKTGIARPARRRLVAGDRDRRGEESVGIPKRDDDLYPSDGLRCRARGAR